MNRRSLSFALIIMALAAVAASGCYVYARPAPGLAVSVGFPPPAFPAEVVVGAPGPGLVWVGGYYDWSVARRDYLWIPGRWLRPPFRSARWYAPHWERHRGQSYYYRGTWR